MSNRKRDLLGDAISAGVVTRAGDGSVHYDTNLVCETTFDNGVNSLGAHGRFAKFSETRTQTLVGNTANYSVALVRATIATNEIPLFVARPSKYIIENGVPMWECTAQPGLSYTWTGPVYTTNSVSVGPAANVDWLYAAYPNSGFIPYYTACTVPGATPTVPQIKYGVIDLSTVGVSSDTLATVVASRLTTLLSAAAGFTVTVTSPTASPSASMTQQYSIANASATMSLYLDFSFPVSYAQNRWVYTATNPSKAGILQACKLLGFVPGQVFVAAAATTTLAPRAYQLGYRSTLDLYSYKNARWVPEDANVPIPGSDKALNDLNSTYFYCHSYQHFLQQVINPTFQRCIYDPYDFSGLQTVPLPDQSLQRQLQVSCFANCSAVYPWNESTSYVANVGITGCVVQAGVAYICILANSGKQPTSSPQYWQSCGASINYSYQDGKIGYLVGDVVTISNGQNTYYATATTTTTGAPPTSASSANGWTSVLGFANNGDLTQIQAMIPVVATQAPTISFNPSTSLFTLNLDSYGFGGTAYANADDGNFGVLDDPQFKASTQQKLYNQGLNDIARDSWGVTGTNNLTTVPYVVARHPGVAFDERCMIEADDYFHQLFGNWPALRLNYFDPATSLTTTYVRYVPQAANAGLTTPSPLPLTATTPGSVGLSGTYLPYGRLGGTVPYLYTFQQDYPSSGLMWNPVDAIVVFTASVPVDPDLSTPANAIDDGGNVSIQSNGNILKILGEINVKSMGNMQAGQQLRNEIVFDPVTPIHMDMQSSQNFLKFDYQLFLRFKDQTYRALTLSQGGSANLRFVFTRK